MTEMDAQQAKEVATWKAKLAEAQAQKDKEMAEVESYYRSEWDAQMAEMEVAWKAKLAEAQAQRDKEMAEVEA